ncbi:hypothetical protein T4B_1539 [Trichinella pseudospiralis]|uniref:Uncharacterized protein n=1 Tax=Trichinella pseudospiralis TaxID=6337 RepID=A0A0V1IG85_TRIPS|nr:hypothetical protein T4B_1539 [Trichinella pseudospiralis]
MLCILGSSVLTSQFLNCHVACVVYLKLSRYTVGSNMLGEQFVYGHRDESLQILVAEITRQNNRQYKTSKITPNNHTCFSGSIQAEYTAGNLPRLQRIS